MAPHEDNVINIAILIRAFIVPPILNETRCSSCSIHRMRGSVIDVTVYVAWRALQA